KRISQGARICAGTIALQDVTSDSIQQAPGPFCRLGLADDSRVGVCGRVLGDGGAVGLSDPKSVRGWQAGWPLAATETINH
ncbi:MAG TPA: hypothetical protein PKV33_10600, partial [Methanothrix sp.]|nr:hypothetical protein [Methanothrix sp.]